MRPRRSGYRPCRPETSWSSAASVLGRSARLRGAECDQIPASLPGVGYIVLEGVREPVRVRASLVTDADVADTVARFRPSQAPEPVRHLGIVDG